MNNKENDKDIVIVDENNIIVEDEEYKINFNQSYFFEGEEYKSIDLLKMTEMTTRELKNIHKKVSRDNSGSELIPESSLTFAIEVAHMVTKLPLEFFYNLSAKDMTKIRLKVFNFFLS